MAVVTFGQLKVLDGYLVRGFTGAFGKVAISNGNFTCRGQEGGGEWMGKDKSKWGISNIEITCTSTTMYSLAKPFFVCVGSFNSTLRYLGSTLECCLYNILP